MAGTQSTGVMAKFPIDIQGEWRHVDLDIKNGKLPEQQKKDLLHNIRSVHTLHRRAHTPAA